MQPKHIVIVGVLVVAAFFVGWLFQKKPETNEHAPLPRDTVAQAPRDVEPRPFSRPPAAVEPEHAAKPVESPEASPSEMPPEDTPTATPPEAPEVVLDRPVTDEEIKAGIKTFASSLQNLIYGGEKGLEAAKTLRDLLALATPEQMNGLIQEFGDDSMPMGERVVLAHALAQSEQPEALATLQDALRDPESGMMVHRFAAHGLAFSDAEGLDTFMLDMAHNHAERGVRANLAFGLQRRGIDEGITLYFAATDEAFEKGDPSALQYLSGLVLIDERAYPGIRERLGTYESTEGLLVLIGIVQRRKDTGAVPALEALAYDSSRPVSVQKAAQGALKVLAEEKGKQ